MRGSVSVKGFLELAVLVLVLVVPLVVMTIAPVPANPYSGESGGWLSRYVLHGTEYVVVDGSIVKSNVGHKLGAASAAMLARN
jgi:hypothetical protein